mmetsp:Transcript_117859/g.345291  ORF Transcript_117859/g.345291 Transcript_117859/m.345291 type:complete len:227 (+) Transcript_117859:369-1049(+)
MIMGHGPIDHCKLPLLRIHNIGMQPQLLVHEIDHLCRIEFAVLQRMPRQLYAYAPGGIVLVELLCATHDITSYVIAKAASHFTQRELQHSTACMPPQLTRGLVIRREAWITKEADILQDPITVRQTSTLQQACIALGESTGPHQLLVQPPRHLGGYIGTMVLCLQRGRPCSKNLLLQSLPLGFCGADKLLHEVEALLQLRLLRLQASNKSTILALRTGLHPIPMPS